MKLFDLFRSKKPVSTEPPIDYDKVVLPMANQALAETKVNQQQIKNEIERAANKAIQQASDEWEKNFNFFIQNGVKNGKIGGILERRGMPAIPKSLLDKLETHGFHICYDHKTYGYTDIVIINWEVEKPNFYNQDWSNYWMQIGTKHPPYTKFD